ncbi:MAG: 50S ribosomal protein L35 [Dehalococcoidia bacterium]
MPKIKTHKGARRRFHISATGKVLRTKGPKSHLRRNKAPRVKRLFGSKVELDSPAFSRRIKHALGGARR